MSRDEQRAQTRERLLAAAEELFAKHGIPETSIEQIAETAGYSRGAFYSNFDDKDALVVGLIERHHNRSMGETNALADIAADPDDFLARLFDREASQSDSRATIGIEYIMYASRNPEGRPQVKELNRRLLAQHALLAQRQFDDRAIGLPMEAEDAAKILLALDEGFALLRLIDPDAFPVGSWSNAVAILNEAAVALSEKRAREES